MKTLQEHYTAIKNGQGNKAQFLKQARSLFPEYFNQYTDFDTATNVLKSKQIISEAAGGVVSKGFDIWDWKKILAEETSKDFKVEIYGRMPGAPEDELVDTKYFGTKEEAKKWIKDNYRSSLSYELKTKEGKHLNESVKAVEKETSKEVLDYRKNAYDNADMKNADNVNFNEIMKGFYCEMKDEKNKDKTGDELKAIVVKNLAKDPLYYTKNGEFGTKGVGYTTEAPGLGEPKEPKGKHKSSGYGDLKEGIGMFNDPIGYKKSEPSDLDKMFTKEYKGNGVYVIYKNGEEVKTIEGEGNANAWINDEMRKLKENTKAEKWDKLSDDEKLNKLLSVYKDPDDAEKHIHKSWDKLPDLATVNIKLGESLEEGIEKYNNMSDQEIIQWAYDDGFEDYIEYNDNDGLANREEVLRALLGIEDLGSEESEEEMWGPDDIDPAGGYGPSSHMESVAEQKLRSLIRNIIKEELDK